MPDLDIKSFALSLKRKVSNIQEPGTATVTTSELEKAGVTIPKGDKRLKEGVTMDNLSPADRKKVEAIRKEFES